MPELQLCPNCGGSPILHKRKKYYYECDGDCWTQTDKYNTAEEAADEWNKLKPSVKEFVEIEVK